MTKSAGYDRIGANMVWKERFGDMFGYRRFSADLVEFELHPQVTPQDVLDYCLSPRTKREICEHFGYKDLKHFSAKYINPLIEAKQLFMTVPDKPNSRNQKYYSGDGAYNS